MPSPIPGATSTSVVSASEAISSSDCPTPDGLDQHDVAAGRVQHPQRLRGRPRQPAEVPAGGHRPDVDAAVAGVVLHPDAVAEQRTAGERGRRVDGEHADPLARLPERPHERRRRRRLADTGRAGQARAPGRGRCAATAPPRPRAARGSRPRPARSAGRPTARRPRGRRSTSAGTSAVRRPRRPRGASGAGVWTAVPSEVTPWRARTGWAGRGRAGSGRRPGRRRRTARRRRRRRRGGRARGRGAARSGRRSCRPGGRARSRRR